MVDCLANGIGATLSIDADILAFPCVVLADHTSRIWIASIICLADSSSSWWCAANVQVAWVSLESLQALADANPVLHCAGCIRSTHPVFTGTDAVPPVVNARHAGTQGPTVVVVNADNGWDGWSEGGGWHAGWQHWRGWHVAASSTRHRGLPWHSRNHSARFLRSASEQWVADHSRRTNALEASKGIDAAGFSTADTTSSKALIDVIAACEGVSLKTCWTAAVHSVTRLNAVGVGSTADSSAARFVLRAARVGIAVETRVADALVVHGVHAVGTDPTARRTHRRQNRWDAHDLCVAQEVWKADAAAGMFVTTRSNATLNILTSIYADTANTILPFLAGPGFRTVRFR